MVRWFRKDNRIEIFTVAENQVIAVDLQTKGTEPVVIDNSGSDVLFGYNRNGPWFTIPDGYQYTWEKKHPYNTEFFVSNTTNTTTTITFLIGGSNYE